MLKESQPLSGSSHLRFSQDIKFILQKLTEQHLSLKDVLNITAERGFSLVMVLLVLPFLFPMPPGLTGPFGGACFLLAIQMSIGRKTPWLPRQIYNYRFPRSFAQALLKNLHRLTRIVEKITRPRWGKLAKNPLTWRINGLCIAWLCLLLISPIPFTNPFPTIAILLLAVATLESDGLLMSIGYLVTGLVTLLFIFIGYGLWLAPSLLPNIFQVSSSAV